MQYGQCKCGRVKFFGDHAPRSCQGCEECGTTIETNPEKHRKPDPHDIITETTTIEREGHRTIVRVKKYCMNCRHSFNDGTEIVKEGAET